MKKLEDWSCDSQFSDSKKEDSSEDSKGHYYKKWQKSNSRRRIVKQRNKSMDENICRKQEKSDIVCIIGTIKDQSEFSDSGAEESYQTEP